jgi:hypothetical protein
VAKALITKDWGVVRREGTCLEVVPILVEVAAVVLVEHVPVVARTHLIPGSHTR